MKIAVYCRVWPPHGIGGMQIAARNAALGLSERGHEVHIFTTGLKDFSGRFEDQNLVVHYTKSAPGKYSAEYFDEAHKQFLEIGGFNIIYSHSTSGRRHLGGEIPIVAQWHGIGGMKDVENLMKVGIKVDPKFFDREILKYPRHIAIAPHEGRYLVENGIREDQIRVILYGTNQFRKDIQLRNSVRLELGISDSEFLIGLAGRLVTDKGIEQVAKISSRLPRNARILLIGEGGCVRKFQEGTIWRKARTANEMCGYYNAMDVLVDPTTRNQGFDITPIEAASCGTPVLLSNVGSFKEVFSTGAFFFELGNLNTLLFQLCTLAGQEEKENLRNSIYKLAKEKFSYSRMIDEIENELLKFAK